ncbi:MAG TPA: IclR family transcriptional regulator [Hyphomicrobiaceae bacterium]
MSSLANGLRLLALLKSPHVTLRVSEAARELRLPKSTVSRLLKELTQAGLLERDGEGPGFRSGPELFRLGSLYRARLPVENRIDEALNALVHRYPATAYVGVLRGVDLIVLRRHEGVHPVRFIQEPGSCLPAYATAVGKALLARRPFNEIVEALPERLVCETRDVNMTRDALLDELETARRRGYAELDDRLLGIGAVGVAIGLAPGRDIGFAICFSRDIAPSDKEAIAQELCELAREIGRLCDD